MDFPIEQHPLPFFLPSNASLLMLGSFPPPRKRWCMDFFYPNIQNDMWRILGLLFFNDKEFFLIPGKKIFDETKIRAFCKSVGIAIGDTAYEIKRLKNNASDKFLEIVTPLDIEATLDQLPYCKAIAVTGQKAVDTLLGVLSLTTQPKVGHSITFQYKDRPLKLYRMPSSSRAYPLAITEKAKLYGTMFAEVFEDFTYPI